MRLLTSLFLFTTFAPCASASAPPQKPTPSRQTASHADVQLLIRQLGSDDGKVREEATRKLMKLDAAEPAIRKALTSTDAEVARRARRILDALTNRRLKRAVEKMKADARAGRADLLAERIVCWEGANDAPDCWEPLLTLCERLVPRDEKIGAEIRANNGVAPVALPRYVEWARPQFLARGVPDLTRAGGQVGSDSVGVFAARARNIVVRGQTAGLFASSNSTQLGMALRSIVLAGGSVEVEMVGNLIVICDGDFEAKKILDRSVIIARGNVRCPESVCDSVILAGADVTIPNTARARNVLIRTAGKIVKGKALRVEDCEFKEKDRRALSCVRFFETKQVGLEVEADKAGLRVASLDPQKAFAKAGLKTGDEILSLDGSKVSTAEAFRRLLRRRVVLEGHAELLVRRDGKSLTVRVPLD